MTNTMDTEVVGRPRRDADEPRLLDEAMAEALIEQAREQGVELLGEHGLLRQMTKAVLERALAEELTEHLSYEHVGSGRARDREQPQRVHPEAAADRGRQRRPGGAPGPGRLLRPAGRAQGAATSGWHRKDRAGALFARDDRPRHPRPATGDVRCRGLPGPDLQDHRLGARGGQGVADPPARRGLAGDLPRRDRLQGPPRRHCDRTGPPTWPSGSTSTARRRSWASGWRPARAPSSGCG